MNKEEIENIKRHLGVALYNHTRNFYDYDMQVDCNITYNQLKLLGEYINQLEANRDEAIEFVKKWDYENTMCIDDFYFQEELLSLLERGKE